MRQMNNTLPIVSPLQIVDRPLNGLHDLVAFELIVWSDIENECGKRGHGRKCRWGRCFQFYFYNMINSISKLSMRGGYFVHDKKGAPKVAFND